MAPELEPVQPHGRFGVFRGAVVAVTIIAFVATAVLKPWGNAPEQVQSEPTDPAASIAVATQPTRDDSTPPPPAFALSDAVAALASLVRDGEAAWVVPGPSDDPVRVPFVATSPSTSELGLNCDGAVLVGEGATAIGVTLPELTRPSAISRIALNRQFDALPPVSLPLVAEVDDDDDVILVSSRDGPWAPGYYSLMLDVRGRSGIVPFCIGAMLRDVDYSLIVFVPSTADGAAARRGLLADLAR